MVGKPQAEGAEPARGWWFIESDGCGSRRWGRAERLPHRSVWVRRFRALAGEPLTYCGGQSTQHPTAPVPYIITDLA